MLMTSGTTFSLPGLWINWTDFVQVMPYSHCKMNIIQNCLKNHPKLQHATIKDMEYFQTLKLYMLHYNLLHQLISLELLMVLYCYYYFHNKSAWFPTNSSYNFIDTAQQYWQCYIRAVMPPGSPCRYYTHFLWM